MYKVAHEKSSRELCVGRKAFRMALLLNILVSYLRGVIKHGDYNGDTGNALVFKYGEISCF